MALDLGFLISELLEERGVLARGLAHPSVFQQGSNANGGMGNLISNFGAVPVSPRNMFKLLRNGEVLLLFPGGVREALKKSGEDYELFWPDEAEFVRIAARFNGTIVTLAGVGIDDAIDVVASGQDLLKLPLVGDRLRESSANIQKVREDEPNLVFPITLPKNLNRLYFKFGKAKPLTKAIVDDKEAVASIYGDIKAELEGDIRYLLEMRDKDPYKDILPRMAWEQTRVVDGRVQQRAPTFETHE